MTPDDFSSKNWDRLTRLARQAATPEVDVSQAVLRAIRLPARSSESATIFDLLTALTGSGWLRATLATVAVVAGVAGYEGLQSSDTLLLALGFSF
jgi:hypothetical protein